MTLTNQTILIMNKVLLSTIFAAFALSSCTVTKHNAYYQDVARTDVIQAPVIADLEVTEKPKLRGTYRAHKLTEAEAKQSALYTVMQASGCDVVVHPSYEVKFFPSRVIEVTVNGFCGRYRNFRKPTLEDVTLMQELETAIPMFRPESAVTKKSLFKIK